MRKIDGYEREIDGNRVYTTNGCSNHSEKERETDDYYATEPKAVPLLLEWEKG